jgi:hypothetical protein
VLSSSGDDAAQNEKKSMTLKMLSCRPEADLCASCRKEAVIDVKTRKLANKHTPTRAQRNIDKNMTSGPDERKAKSTRSKKHAQTPHLVRICRAEAERDDWLDHYKENNHPPQYNTIASCEDHRGAYVAGQRGYLRPCGKLSI